MEGASSIPGRCAKPGLSWDEQVALMVSRGLAVHDQVTCARFLAATNYYRFSGYARYFQRAPHLGGNDFRQGTTFDEFRAVYDADEALRAMLVVPLARVELMLRSHVARVIADDHRPYGQFLEKDFYTDVGDREPTVESCLRDIERSKDRHILHYRKSGVDRAHYAIPCRTAWPRTAPASAPRISSRILTFRPGRPRNAGESRSMAAGAGAHGEVL